MPLRRCIALLLLCCLLPIHALLEEEAPIVVFLEPEDGRPALGQSGLLEAHFLNVGWADCILLRMGDETMLVDCGHRETGGEVVAYLRDLGIDKLDYAFMTHFHNDHIGGFLEVFEEMPVGEVLVPAGFEDFSSLLYNELCELMEEKTLPIAMLQSGDTMAFGDTALTFYQWDNTTAPMNDRSMLLHVQYGDRAMLLAADVENNAQKALAELLGEALGADILKMPHHGLAAYMREFHAAVQPSLAIYSNAKHRIERNIKLTEQRHVAWRLTTRGTIVAASDGGPWQVWQEP